MQTKSERSLVAYPCVHEIQVLATERWIVGRLKALTIPTRRVDWCWVLTCSFLRRWLNHSFIEQDVD